MIPRQFILLLLLPVFIIGCEDKLTPAQATELFWAAVQSGNEERVRKLASRETLDAVSDKGTSTPEIESWETGKILIDGERSEVETELTLSAKKPKTARIDTYLVMQEGHWKIDYASTMKQLDRGNEVGIALNRLDEISSDMIEKLDKSIDEFHEAMPVIEEEISKIGEQLEEKVPEIRRRLDELMRKLEEALRQKQAPAQDQPIEI